MAMQIGGGWGAPPGVDTSLEPPVQLSAVDVQPRAPAPPPRERGLLGFLGSPEAGDMASGLLAMSGQLLQGSTDPSIVGTRWARGGQAYQKAVQASQDRRRKLAMAEAEAKLKARQVAAQEMQARAAMARAGRSNVKMTGSAKTGYYAYDPVTGQSTRVIAGVGEPPTTLQRNLQAAGLEPGTPEYEQAVLQAVQNQGSTTVNIGSKEQDKYMGRALAKRADAISQGAEVARTRLMNLQALQALHNELAASDVTTGPGRPTLNRAANLLRTLGFEDLADEVSRNPTAAGAMEALGNAMALELRNPAGGAGMPGAMSDADRIFLASMVPSLGANPNAARLTIAIQSAVAKRTLDREQAMYRYMEENDGRLDYQFFNDWRQYVEDNPLFPLYPSQAEADKAVQSGKIKSGDLVRIQTDAGPQFFIWRGN